MQGWLSFVCRAGWGEWDGRQAGDNRDFKTIANRQPSSKELRDITVSRSSYLEIGIPSQDRLECFAMQLFAVIAGALIFFLEKGMALPPLAE